MKIFMNLGVQIGSVAMKTVYLLILNISVLWFTTIPLLEYTQKKLMYICTSRHTRMFIAALTITATNCKNSWKVYINYKIFTK